MLSSCLSHHPLWFLGLPVLGIFSTLADYGSLKDLRWLIGRSSFWYWMYFDWVPAHFPMDEWIATLTESLSLSIDPKRIPPGLEYTIFDYGRPEIRSFLLSSARFWLEEIGLMDLSGCCFFYAVP